MDDPPVPRKPVGTVADEAARLIEALGGWAHTAPSSEAEAGEPTTHPGGEPGGEAGAAGNGPGARPGPNRAEDADGADPGEHAHHRETCAHCGAPVLGVASPAVAAVCRVCPVCQGVGLLSTLRPETLDRLVEVASAALVGLRTLAEQARAGSPAEEAPPAPGRAVEDIPVLDEDASAGGRGADSR